MFRKYLLWLKWDSSERIAKVETPIFFIYGKKDSAIPFTNTLHLFIMATKSLDKGKFCVEEGTHSDCWTVGGNSYFAAINDFMSKQMTNRKESTSNLGTIKESAELTGEDTDFGLDNDDMLEDESKKE